MDENEDAQTDETPHHEGLLHRVVDKVRHAMPDIERGLTNEVSAIPGAGGDFNVAGGETLSAGAGGIPPGSATAAGGSLTDVEPVGHADEEEDLRRR